MRWILAEAAQRAKRDPAFAASYPAIAHRRGRGIATVAIARKLLARAFHLLTEHANTAGAADTGTTTTKKIQPTTGRTVTSTGRAHRIA